MTGKEFSLYEEEENIISRANEFLSLEDIDNIQYLQTEYKHLLDNYKKLFKQSKRLIRMSDRMEAELATTKAELEKYSKKLQVQATTDTLTGLANRRKITELLQEESKELIKNNKKHYIIIMMDIDHFKKVNDNYGHPMGDQVIRKVSNQMQNKIGSEGIVGRFGGEEFLTILYNDDINFVGRLSNEIREEIEKNKIEFEGKTINVTVSMGIASSVETKLYKELINKADERLYKAKENGRNRVILS